MKKLLFFSLCFAGLFVLPNLLMANGEYYGGQNYQSNNYYNLTLQGGSGDYWHDNGGDYWHDNGGDYWHGNDGHDGSGDKPNVGAPLDGGLISLLLGSAGIAYIGRKRKKGQAIQ